MNNDDFNSHIQSLRLMLIGHLNKHHVIFPDPIREELVARNNSLIYRTSSIQWNYNQLLALVTHTKLSSLNQSNRDEIIPNIMNALSPISYNFDDVIFNLVSMFDYLAGLLILVISGEQTRRCKWNSLYKTLKDNHKGFPETAEKTVQIHQKWVDKIAGYRGGLYHEKDDRSTAEHFFDFNTGEDRISFFLPKVAMKKLPYSSLHPKEAEHKLELTAGVNQLIDESLRMQKLLIETCYSEKNTRIGNRRNR